MAFHGTPRRVVVALAAAPLVIFVTALLISASASFAAPNPPAGLLRSAPSYNDSFGNSLPATHLGTVHAIWREPASHSELKLRRIPCAGAAALSAGLSCFAAATAG